MANRLLRNIAVSIGAGLAAGIGRKLLTRRASRPAPDFHPILSRLEDIESRVMRVELTPQSFSTPAPEEIAALGTLVSSQSEDIAALRQDIQRIERRNSEQVDAFGQKVALFEQQVSQHIESSVNFKIAELETRLRGEFRDIHYRTVDAFAEAIEKRVVGRINTLENSLIEQSHSIINLRDKSLKTDDHLNRLLEAVERLCARAEAQTQMPLVEATPEPAPIPQAALPQAPPPPLPVPPALPAMQPEVEGPLEEADRIGAPHGEARLHRGEEPAVEPAFVAATAGQPRHDYKPLGVAILGLALIGFRLIR